MLSPSPPPSTSSSSSSSSSDASSTTTLDALPFSHLATPPPDRNSDGHLSPPSVSLHGADSLAIPRVWARTRPPLSIQHPQQLALAPLTSFGAIPSPVSGGAIRSDALSPLGPSAAGDSLQSVLNSRPNAISSLVDFRSLASSKLSSSKVFSASPPFSALLPGPLPPSGTAISPQTPLHVGSLIRNPATPTSSQFAAAGHSQQPHSLSGYPFSPPPSGHQDPDVPSSQALAQQVHASAASSELAPSAAPQTPSRVASFDSTRLQQQQQQQQVQTSATSGTNVALSQQQQRLEVGQFGASPQNLITQSSSSPLASPADYGYAPSTPRPGSSYASGSTGFAADSYAQQQHAHPTPYAAHAMMSNSGSVPVSPLTRSDDQHRFAHTHGAYRAERVPVFAGQGQGHGDEYGMGFVSGRRPSMPDLQSPYGKAAAGYSVGSEAYFDSPAHAHAQAHAPSPTPSYALHSRAPLSGGGELSSVSPADTHPHGASLSNSDINGLGQGAGADMGLGGLGGGPSSAPAHVTTHPIGFLPPSHPSHPSEWGSTAEDDRMRLRARASMPTLHSHSHGHPHMGSDPYSPVHSTFEGSGVDVTSGYHIPRGAYDYPHPSEHQPSAYSPRQASHLPPSMGSSAQHQQGQDPKTYSFVSLPGNAMKKRPRRRYDEIERLYACNWPGCTKSYGTLNHLNAHVSMQRHGQKRCPSEFKEMRKHWRKMKKEQELERERQVAQEAALGMPRSIQDHIHGIHSHPPHPHSHHMPGPSYPQSHPQMSELMRRRRVTDPSMGMSLGAGGMAMGGYGDVMGAPDTFGGPPTSDASASYALHLQHQQTGVDFSQHYGQRHGHGHVPHLSISSLSPVSPAPGPITPADPTFRFPTSMHPQQQHRTHGHGQGHGHVQNAGSGPYGEMSQQQPHQQSQPGPGSSGFQQQGGGTMMGGNNSSGSTLPPDATLCAAYDPMHGSSSADVYPKDERSADDGLSGM